MLPIPTIPPKPIPFSSNRGRLVPLLEAGCSSSYRSIEMDPGDEGKGVDDELSPREGFPDE